ncbi:nucleotidyltransferase domain-containing protein [Candidatus Nomurabacteria bacterium]|nr:nucleotidyltransferase domain-containing protein [Candidatus Nomurabacteria bacterium]
MNINELQSKMIPLAEKYNLKLVVLFGSQASGRTHKRSDIDIAVIGKVAFDMTRLTIDFYNLFNREDVEIVDISSASPTTMYVVVRDGKLLYESESGAFLKWKLYAMWVWRDTAWLRRLRDKKLVEWAKTA